MTSNALLKWWDSLAVILVVGLPCWWQQTSRNHWWHTCSYLSPYMQASTLARTTTKLLMDTFLSHISIAQYYTYMYMYIGIHVYIQLQRSPWNGLRIWALVKMMLYVLAGGSCIPGTSQPCLYCPLVSHSQQAVSGGPLLLLSLSTFDNAM